MTTMNSNEREERLKQIRERWSRMNMPQTVFTSHCKGDIDFLLSLLDSQAAEPVTYYNEDGSYNPVGKNIADHAATQMRDQCAAKVREMPTTTYDYRGNTPMPVELFKRNAITALESLTLDVEQKEANGNS